MSRLGMEEGEVMEHKWLNRSVETAQRRVEQQHFAIRKRTLEYDDVMNKQRAIVYDLRSRVLKGDNKSVHSLVLDVINDLIINQAERYLFSDKDGRVDEFIDWMGVTFPVSITAEELKAYLGRPIEAAEFVYKKVEEAYECKCASEDQEILPHMERGVFLSVIDREWQDYLRAMDDLRHGVNLRAYGQRDPLVEYKKEAFGMFEELMNSIKSKVVSSEFRSATMSNMRRMMMQMESTNERIRTNESDITITDSELEDKSKVEVQQTESQKTIGDVFASMMSSASRPGAMPPNLSPMSQPTQKQAVGRNDSCPCGSGKKYKKCCGRLSI
jgi:preprotein translocase subunit SecA